MDVILDKAEPDPRHKKLFIRGVSFESTNESVSAFFSQYGEVQEAAIATDRFTGKKKGYGFVTFKDIYGAYGALEDRVKLIEVCISLVHPPLFICINGMYS